MKKPILISTVLALLLGFSLGWLLRPASHTEIIDVTSNDASAPRDTASDNPSLSRPHPKPKPSIPSSNPEPLPPQLSSNTKPPESLQKAEEAKWLHVIEILNLNSDQVKALEAAIAENRPIPDENTPMDAAYAEAGERLEQAILAMLTPEQQVAFRETQQRALDNRIEVKAQEKYSESLAYLDLTSAQREQTLNVLRRQAKQDASTLSSGTRLLLGGSFLPIGDEKTTDESFELMGQLQLKAGEEPPTFEKIAAMHRAELERRMTQFEGILTSGQLAIYRAQLSQSMENLDILSPRR